MKYMGSKARIANEILPIILKDRMDEQWYVEPFCGGLGTFDKVTGLRIANDKNKYLIAMWKGLQENRPRPHEISKELYSKARTEFNNGTNIEFDDFMIGWIGFMGSFNGRFFDGGYNGAKTSSFIRQGIANIEKQISSVIGAVFISMDYDKIDYPQKSIIYCDPPYYGTKGYSTSKDFNHSKFWQWCRDMSISGHRVFISEYQAPNDFTCIWEKQITNSMNSKKTYITTERLFTI